MSGDGEPAMRGKCSCEHKLLESLLVDGGLVHAENWRLSEPPGGRTVRAPPEGLSEPPKGESQSPQGEPRDYMREVSVPAL